MAQGVCNVGKRTGSDRQPRPPANSAWLNAGGNEPRPRSNSSWLTAEAEKPPTPPPPPPKPPSPTYAPPTWPQRQPPPPVYAPVPTPVQQPGNGLATASLVLGIISVAGLVTVLASACVIPLAIIGLVLGFVALKRPGGRGKATAGIVMNGLVSLLSLLIFVYVGVSLLVTIFSLAASP
jgi:hypothetical protein